MTSSLGNVQSGRAARAAWLVVPAAVAVLSVTGVTVKPALGLEDAKVLRAAAEKRGAAFAAERARALPFQKDHGLERLEEAMRTVQEVIPLETSPLALHGIVQVLARNRGLAPEAVVIGSPRATDLDVLDDKVVVVEAELRGSGTLDALIGLVGDLRQAGFPLGVSEFTLSRADPSDSEFELRVTLGFLQRVPVARKPADNRQGGP